MMFVLGKLQSEADLVICAWTKSGKFIGRSQHVLSLLKNPHCLDSREGRFSPSPPLQKSGLNAGSAKAVLIKERHVAKVLQTVWKRLRLSGDKSRKLLSAIVEHSGAGCRL
jgi:hypothetical protein